MQQNTQVKVLIGLSLAGLVGGGVYAAAVGGMPTIDQDTKYAIAREFAVTAELTLQLEHSYTPQQQEILAGIKKHTIMKQTAWDKAVSQCGTGYTVQFGDEGPVCVKVPDTKIKK